jgi:hypothetical protein
MKRSLSVLIALFALGAIAAGPAAAKKPKPVKFLATFTGERHIAWNEPRWETADRQCDAKEWEYGEGEETWEVKSKSVKVLALGSGSSALLKFGTWSDREPSATFGLEASGHRKRRSDIFNGKAPGLCGGEYIVNPPAKNDCGERLPKHLVVPAFDGRKLALEVLDAPDNQAPGFSQCTIYAPKEVRSVDSWGRHTGLLDKKVKDKNLFGKAKTLTFHFRDTWDGEQPAGNGLGHIAKEATVEWTLTLTRVR